MEAAGGTGMGVERGDGAEGVAAGGIGAARVLALAPGARAPERGLGGASDTHDADPAKSVR